MELSPRKGWHIVDYFVLMTGTSDGTKQFKSSESGHNIMITGSLRVLTLAQFCS